MFFIRTNWRAMGLFTIVISSIMLIVALGLAAYSWRFRSSAVPADAKVVTFDVRNGVYYPVYTFADSQGTIHTIHSSMGSFPPEHAVGDTIKLLVQANNPSNTMINDFEDLWLAIGMQSEAG